MTPKKPWALVVDDATTAREFHRTILEEAGLEVGQAMNGVEALERALAAPAPPDLLVVDVNMPRLDGYGLLQALRADATLRGVPAIVVTTAHEPEEEARGFASGANLFLAKPVRPDVLARFARALTGLPA